MNIPGNGDSATDDGMPETFALLDECDRSVIGSYQRKIAEHIHDLSRLEGLGQLRSKHCLPVRLLKTFQKVMALYDASTRYFLGRLHHRGKTVQCRSDCIYCCYNMPSGLSTMELIHIYHGSTLSGLGPRLFRRCLEAQERWSELCRRDCRSNHSVTPPPTPREALLKSYQGLAAPCPFLQGTSCIIYPYRPLACRMHFSLSPPSWCDPTHFQNSYAIRFNAEPGECVQNALDVLDDCFHLNISDIMVCGLLELTINVMEFEPIQWK